MHTFYIERLAESDSGAPPGRCVEGVVLSNGWVALAWMDYNTSACVYTSMDVVHDLHALEGFTEVRVSTDVEARPFFLERSSDVSGHSGTGRVAEGVEFVDGRVVMVWQTEHPSAAFYSSIRMVERIHGHDGASRVVFGE